MLTLKEFLGVVLFIAAVYIIVTGAALLWVA